MKAVAGADVHAACVLRFQYQFLSEILRWRAQTTPDHLLFTLVNAKVGASGRLKKAETSPFLFFSRVRKKNSAGLPPPPPPLLSTAAIFNHYNLRQQPLFTVSYNSQMGPKTQKLLLFGDLFHNATPITSGSTMFCAAEESSVSTR